MIGGRFRFGIGPPLLGGGSGGQRSGQRGRQRGSEGSVEWT